MVLENIRLAEQAQQNSGVCTSGGCGLELEQGCGEWAQEVMGQLQWCSPGAG